MKKVGGMTFTLILPLAVGLILLVASLSSFTYINMKSTASETAQAAAMSIFDELGGRIGLMSDAIKRKAVAFSEYEGLNSHWVLYNQSVQSRKLDEYLQKVLAESVNISSVGVILDPRTWGRGLDEVVHAPFAVRSGDSTAILDIAEENANYLSADAYLVVRSSGTPVWTDSPLAKDGVDDSIAYVYPIENGAIVFDVERSFIENLVAKTEIPYRGALRITSAFGKKIFSSKNLPPANSRIFIVRYPVPETGWTMEVLYPKSALESKARESAVTMLVIGAVGALFIVIVMALIISSISKSLKKLRDAAETLSKGDINTSIEKISTPSEVAELCDNIESMRLDIAKHVAGNERELLEREGIRREDRTARDIQRFYLPDSSLVEDRGYAIAASFKHGKIRRGVFYDMVPTSRATVYIVVGEISGGDVPTLLSLSRVLVYMRALLWDGPKPAHALSRLNGIVEGELGEENRMSLLLAEFHPATGLCVISSANSNGVILVREGEASSLDLPDTEALGAEEPSYANTVFNMNRGDAVLFYSPGMKHESSNLFRYVVDIIAEVPSAEDVISSLYKSTEPIVTDDSPDSAMVLLKYE